MSVFLDNKYTRWYYAIIEQRKANPLADVYVEEHHIIPRSMGGTEGNNLVVLSAREHFICHWLLTRMTVGEDRAKMVYALRMMRVGNSHHQRYQTKITARVYEKLKQEYSLIASTMFSGEKNGFYGKTHTEEVKNRLREANRGDKNGSKKPEARQKIREKKLGTTRSQFSDEWLENLSSSHIGEKNHMWGKHHSEATKEKIRTKATGRKQSEETIKKKADAIRGKSKPKKLCEHCGRHIAVNNFPRFHGDNCKHKK